MKVYINDQPYQVTRVFYDRSGNRYVGVKCIPGQDYSMTRMHAFNLGKTFRKVKKSLGLINKKSMDRLNSIRKTTTNNLSKAQKNLGNITNKINKAQSTNLKNKLNPIQKQAQDRVKKLQGSIYNKKPNMLQKHVMNQQAQAMKDAEKGRNMLRRTGNVLMGKKRWDAFHKDKTVGNAAKLAGGLIKRTTGTALAAGAVATGATLYGAKKVVGAAGRAGQSAGRAVMNGVRPQPRNLNARDRDE